MTNKYKFSVIIPVYKVEKYLRETIESVINQSIGFKKYIQIILINDGSPDNSEKICIEYKNKYPNNIIYYKQENSGVSVARNKGIELAEGEYINFLDSDDKWSKDSFAEAQNLFEKYNDITSVVFPMKFFEKSKKEHIINKLYKGKDKIDIREDYSYIKLQSCSVIFKKDIIKSHKFTKELKISEDVRFNTEIFLEHPIIGVAKSFYLYRKRKDGTSALQTSITKKTWYLDTPKYCYSYLIDLSKKKYNKVIKYIQFLLTYDLKWRINIDPETVLSKEETTIYQDTLRKVINNIEDDIISNFKLYSPYEKMYLLNFKYNKICSYKLKDNSIFYEKLKLFEASNIPSFIDNMYINEDNIDIYMKFPKIKNIIEKIYFKDSNGQKIIPKYYTLDDNNLYPGKIDKKINLEYIGAHVTIKLHQPTKLNLYYEYQNKEYKIKLEYSYSSTLNNNFKYLYLKTKHFLLSQENNGLKAIKKNAINTFKYELRCSFKLLSKKQFASFIYRNLANIYKMFKIKPIWIVSDRIQAAGDNGQAFFEYLMEKKLKNKKIYFVIGKNSKDYKILKNKYPNNILMHKTLKHKILFLNSELILSSQADMYVYNLFGTGKYYIGDLYNFKYVFLQHGVTYNDLSPWLNINSRKIDLIVTTSERERNSFINDFKYNYPEQNIVVTGFARYDKLLNKTRNIQNQIVIMPTWRKKLVSEIDLNTGLRKYDPNFKKTDYFKFYNGLINNEKLLCELKKYDYKIKFIPHPNMMAQLKDFASNDYVYFEKGNVNYSEEFKCNKILITDYSSVFFDFAYLKKPIIYTQFDSDDFYNGQLYNKGYFDFKKDGYGEVTTNIEDTVNLIIKYIKNDCQIDKKYLNRVQDFFKYDDSKNCERIYEAIEKITGGKNNR